jgi:hypothetical protein
MLTATRQKATAVKPLSRGDRRECRAERGWSEDRRSG